MADWERILTERMEKMEREIHEIKRALGRDQPKTVATCDNCQAAVVAVVGHPSPCPYCRRGMMVPAREAVRG